MASKWLHCFFFFGGGDCRWSTILHYCYEIVAYRDGCVCAWNISLDKIYCLFYQFIEQQLLYFIWPINYRISLSWSRYIQYSYPTGIGVDETIRVTHTYTYLCRYAFVHPSIHVQFCRCSEYNVQNALFAERKRFLFSTRFVQIGNMV